MPQMGPMAGRAVTVVVEPSQASHRANAAAWGEYRRSVAGVPGPKIVVVQDLDKPAVIGSFWGEVNANTHRALGCVGTITDGAAIRRHGRPGVRPPRRVVTPATAGEAAEAGGVNAAGLCRDRTSSSVLRRAA